MMSFIFRYGFIGLLSALFAYSACLCAQVEVYESAVMKEAVSVRSASGLQAEVNFLVGACKSATAGDPAYDEALLRLSEFYLTSSVSQQKKFAAFMTDEQCLRILARLRGTASARKQVMLSRLLLDGFVQGEALLRDPEARALVMHDLATGYFLTEITPDLAAETWQQMAQLYKDSDAGNVGALYYEAVTAPRSIAALEASHNLAVLQDTLTHNTGASFSHLRFLSACAEPFFSEFLSNDKVTREDKTQFMAAKLNAAYMTGQHKLSLEIAQEVFGLCEWDSRYAQQAAMTTALCYSQMQQHAEAISAYENFMRSFPQSPKVPQALLGIIMSEQSRGNFIQSDAMCAVLVEMFPNAPQANEAKSRMAIFATIAEKGKWDVAAQVDKNRTMLHTFLHPDKPVDIAQLWPQKSIHVPQAPPVKLTGTSSSPPARLAAVVSPDYLLQSGEAQ